MIDDPLRNTQIVKPTWFKSASEDAERTFRLINSNVLPMILRGNFAVTTCLRILRAVFGEQENLAAIEAFRKYVIDSEAYWKRAIEIDDAKN